ncbi:MAG: hypothetical protein AB8G23_07265 [Myxococcota bacterium]
MEYLDPAEARTRPGLRLALTTGVPGPWGEAAKAVFHIKGLDYLPVRQTAGEENEALVEWTGHRNAPLAILDDEPARAGWDEILHLAERLAPTPALIPATGHERALMFGLANEICGEDGLGWNRRHQLLAPMLASPDAATNPALAAGRTLGGQYGWSPEAAERANGRVCQILSTFSDQLSAQKKAGSDYLVGDALSALDLYWATFSAMIEPMGPELNPMPEMMRAAYSTLTPEIAAVADPALIAHRDFIYMKHLKLPLDF